MKFMIVNLFIGILFMNIMSANAKGDNPLLKPFDTPFGVPPFEKIKIEHFKPAFEEAFHQHNLEIGAITNNRAVPTFENTIEALERSGSLLTSVSRVFFNLNSANTNPDIQAFAREISPELTKHGDNIRLNKILFSKVKSVYEQKDKLKLTGEKAVLLEETYKGFIRNGAGLNDTDQAKLRTINEQLASLTLKFGENVLAENNAFQMILDKKEDLAGLPQSLIDAAAETAEKAGHKGKWMFTLQNPSLLPFLQYADKRELREKIWRAYMLRGDNGNEYDNKEVIKNLVNLRIQRAQLLGYQSHAHFILEENMAKNPEGVYKLLDQLWEPALKVAKDEATQFQALINREGGNFNLEPWDWRYYAEKVRQEKFNLDEEALRPYFKLDNVLEGAFTVANKLWGISFKELKNIPVYHEDVRCYEVLDKDGSHLSVFYTDFHPRASKRGGAWMTSFREQFNKDGKRVHPVISIVCNFSPPTGDTPSLLTFDEASTLFHEFGHALHGLFSQCEYVSISGTSVSRDFVELPSQVMEHWAAEDEVMAMYAKHYKTGEVIPLELLNKMRASEHFNQGFITGEYLAASYLDMAFHTLTSPLTLDVNSFEVKEMKKIGLIDEIIPRYRSTYFNHIFAGGYSSGYYSYIWSGVLDSDAFEAFKQNGIFDQKTATSLRKNILERGRSEDPMKLYVKFRGAEPSIEPLLRKRGLLAEPSN
ncbi:MAG: M3 family metallopeptidase [Candidatus Kapabacteria bacterium]|nr:M3 family metallopeptidase [Candidatus Kapabacteria bacterium]